MAEKSDNESNPLERFFEGMWRADLKKTVVIGVSGTILILLLSSLVDNTFPASGFQTNTIFAILFVAFIGIMGASFFQREKEYRDPNLYSFTLGNYETARGRKLDGDAKQVLIDKVRDIPLTLEQVMEVHRIIGTDLEEKEEQRLTPYAR